MRVNQARVNNADVRHPSSTVVMHKRKSASPVHNVLNRVAGGDEICLAEGKDQFRAFVSTGID